MLITLLLELSGRRYQITYIAAFRLDLVHFFLQARQESLPALRQGVSILLPELQLEIPKTGGKRLRLVVRS